jgi:DNA-binding GntR family transcriptional regulator
MARTSHFGAAIGGERFTPVRFPSLPEAVAEKLREAVLAGQLKPGERLVEQKLATSLGIGQPTLREALKELEFQGFVRKSPKKGTYVTELTPEDFRKIQEVRMALEVVAIEQAAHNMTAEAVRELEKLVTTMRTAAQKFDLATFHKSDLRFHRVVWDLTGNEYLGLALERIAFGLFAFVLLQRDPSASNEFIASAEQHAQIVAGLRTRDPKRAREAFVKSTTKFWNQYHRVNLEPAGELK